MTGVQTCALPIYRRAAALLRRGPEVTSRLAEEYRERREVFFEGLEAAGLAPPWKPQGAYYVLVDVSGFGRGADVDCARWMVEEVGVAAVPGSSFFNDPKEGAPFLRFAFCKKLETLREAGRRLKAARAAEARR